MKPCISERRWLKLRTDFFRLNLEQRQIPTRIVSTHYKPSKEEAQPTLFVRYSCSPCPVTSSTIWGPKGGMTVRGGMVTLYGVKDIEQCLSSQYQHPNYNKADRSAAPQDRRSNDARGPPPQHHHPRKAQ